MKEIDVGFESSTIHFLEGGAGFPVLLLHGSGPGVSTQGNFLKIFDRMAERYHVVGMDWIGFGNSGRCASKPYFDMGLWERQLQFALERLPGDRVGILAHSLAAVFALKAAASIPRVTKLLTTGAMGAPFLANEHLRRIWTFPDTPAALRQALECLVFDKEMITEDFVQDRFTNLQQGDYRGYLSSMFEGDKQQYVDMSVLDPALLRRISAEVLMLHGRDDLPIPFEDSSLVLARSIRNADVWILAR